MYEFWHKQAGQPLSPKLFWSRPERREQAGRLLILGGSSHSIAAPHNAYQLASDLSAASVQVLLPDATRKLIGKTTRADVDFVPSTATGSIAQESLPVIQVAAQHVDACLMVGDFSRNSESGIVLEAFARQDGWQTYTKDALDYFYHQPLTLLDRPHTLVVPTFAQLQRMVSALDKHHALTHQMGLVAFVQHLHTMTSLYAGCLAVLYQDTLCVGLHGQVVTTHIERPLSQPWRIEMAVRGSLWLIQQPHDSLGALSAAAFEVADPAHALLL